MTTEKSNTSNWVIVVAIALMLMAGFVAMLFSDPTVDGIGRINTVIERQAV